MAESSEDGAMIKYKKRVVALTCAVGTAIPSFAQGYVQVTRNHENYIMQQFTTMETGAGALTPRYYYNMFHKNYQRTANIENKLEKPH